MRITSGKLGGRRLKGISSLKLRPTTERVREAIFSSLSSIDSLEGRSVADLYAGSGAFGIEAISRGASSCLFVEKDPKNHKQLVENLELLEVQNQTKTFNYSTEKFLLKNNPEKYDLIFADPPYETVLCSEFLLLLKKSSLLDKDSIVIFEDSRELEGEHVSFELFSAKKYGETHVSFFRYLGLGE